MPGISRLSSAARSFLQLAVFSCAVAACGTDSNGSPGLSGDGAPSAEPNEAPNGAPEKEASFPKIPSGKYKKSANIVAVVTPGSTVSTPAGKVSLATKISEFLHVLASGVWWKTISAEYDLGEVAGHRVVTGGPWEGSANEDSMTAYIRDAIDGPPDQNSVYILYLPEGVFEDESVFLDGSCIYDGRHSSRSGLVWGMVQRCGSAEPWLDELDELTYASSHEIMESITDPVPPSGIVIPVDDETPWNGSAWGWGGGENADLCNGTQVLEKGFYFTRVYSNSAAEAGGDPCIPAVSAPYFNVRSPKEWYAVTPGGSVDIPLTGWSTDTLPSWRLFAYGSLDEDLVGPHHQVLQLNSILIDNIDVSTREAPISSGKSVTMRVTAPSDSKSGAFNVIQVISLLNTRYDELSGRLHQWQIGIYVP